MANLGSLIAILVTTILVPWLIRKMPYYRRPDVIARRVAKSQLPGWVSLIELMLLGVSECILVIPSFMFENSAHRILHHGTDLTSYAPQVSMTFVFWLFELMAPIIMVLPLGMLLANSIAWLIRPIRDVENKVMAQGVPGYTWHDLNFGLIKFSLLAAPLCLIVIAISLMRI